MTAGLPLLVTRADPGGAETVERARAMGLDARATPLFAAHSIAWMPPDPASFDALLLTSAQAARLAGGALGALAALPAYAVGPATASTAEVAGLAVRETGDTGAQALIGTMASTGVKRALWLCGRDRSMVDARGIDLVPVPVYAVDSVEPPATWGALIASPAVLMAHSARGAAQIDARVGDARKYLTLIAISDAAAQAAGDGWKKLVIARRPDDAAMLAEAHALCHKGR